MTADDTDPVRIAIDPDRVSEWAVDTNLFGRFAEHIGGALYPGVFENYVLNGTFDVWNESAGSAGPPFDVDTHEGIAYPWEPAGEGADFEQRVGGVRGRGAADALREGVEVPERKRPDPPDVTDSRYQRVALDGSDGAGGVRQRLALPDRRTASFEVALSVRGDPAECTVALDADGETLAAETVPVGSEWARHEVTLTLDDESPERYADDSYGEVALTLTTEGEGRLDLDWVTLVPGDAIEGKFNPETVERLREANVTTLRWPGGNYASQYRWRDGVGPVAERPVTPVANWGGLDQNYLGTNEWLRFCELVDAEPYLTVPVWSPAGPDEAADWVEYCNGDPEETEMGALRAEHGYSEPWDVTYWGVGNEVWGSWQIGRTDADDYAERYREYHDAMRAADPSIEVDACGIDPWFSLVHDGTRESVTLPAEGGDPPVWNDRLFAGAADRIEGVDVHRYTEGISGHTSDDGARQAWLDRNDETPRGYAEVLVNDPGSWDAMFEAVRASAADHGIEDPRITFGEWGLRSGEVEEGWPRASRGTMAHAVYVARAFQALLRNGRDVRLAHWTEFSGYVHPSPYGGDGRHPGAEIARRIAAPVLATDADWHLIETAVSGAPVRERPATGVSIPEGTVPLVDAVSVGASEGDRADPRRLTVVTNGSLARSATVEIEDGGADSDPDGAEVTLFAPADGDPFATGEGADSGAETETFVVAGDATGPIEVTLPPASVALVSV
jgi:alpha-N-arabinofuranosidase